MSEALARKSGFSTLRKKGFIVPAKVNASFGGGTYEGAQAGRRLGGWAPADVGPNRALAPTTLRTLRARCREQLRNNPRAVSARDQYVVNIIGSGIRPKLDIKDAELKKKIMALWERSVDEMDADGLTDFYGQQTMVGNGTFESGEILARRRPRRLSDGLAVPMQVQLLEPDHFSDMVDQKLPSGQIKMGIELNGVGKRVAFHLTREHPSDGLGLGAFDTVRIKADDIAHVFRPLRPGQLRGVPHLASALVSLYELDKYEDAELVRKQQAAMFVGAITNASGALSPETIWQDSDNWVDDRNDFYSNLGKLTTGTWNVLAPGDDIRFNEPGDVGANFEAFLKAYNRKIAASVPITYEQLTGDMENVNFSSARVRLIDLRRRFKADQKQIIVFQFCRKVWWWWLDAAVLSGAIQIPNYFESTRHEFKPEWVADPFEHVDQLKDFLVDFGEVRAGFSTVDEKRIERAKDPEKLESQVAASNARADQLELRFDSDPRYFTKSGVVQKIEDTVNAEAGQ